MSINDIIRTIHPSEKSLSKAKAYAALECYMAQAELSSQERELIRPIVRYFLPAVPKRPKTVFDWIATAVAKDEVRFYLDYVYCDGEYIVGTDGHRLHMAPAMGSDYSYAPGWYLPSGHLTDDPGVEFPDYKKVIPSRENLRWINTERREPFMDILVYKQTIDEKESAYNAKYLDAALLGGDNPKFYAADGRSPLLITFDNDCRAVVMPMRV